MGLPFHLRCLGRPQLISPGGEPVRFRVRKHLALLTYLALEPRVPHRRDKLADLLWANAPPGEGRHSLATAASMIRGKMGRETLEGDRDHLRFTGANLSLDLERLAAGDLFGDEYRPALEVGGFLEDFEVADAQEFMLWSERQRARWLPSIRDALVRLIDRCRRTGDFRQIERLGNSLLDIDELSEDGIRATMEARAFDGDRLTSLKIYEAWKLKLAQELKAAPSPLVEGIAIRLRRRDWETTRSNIPVVPTDQWRGRPFIGRGSEYRTLYESWERTVQRYPHHTLVLGDSGVGKSTLVERVVTAAGLEGAAISRVSCYELEREIPYAAMGGLISGLLDRPEVAGTPPECLAELSRTVPEIRRRFPSIPEPIETQGETARIRLTEAVQQLAIAIAEEHPVILVIDDVHLADDASLAVLHLLMRRTLDQRIMVLLAARPAELGQSPHAVWLRGGHESLRMQILELSPMSERECEEMLASLLPGDSPQPSATARRALLHAAAGFPMVLEYLVKDWEINGEQCLALSIGAMTEEPRTAAAPNKTYHLIVQRIVQALEPSVRNVLNMASVLGARVNDTAMYTLADVSMGQTMTALGKLADMRMLRDGGVGLEFCNELVRGEVYLGVPSPVRKTLHRSIAERLLDQENRGVSIPGLEIAWHCIRAGMRERATPYLLRGGREAIRRGAPHEAERALETGLGHLEEPDKTDAMLLLAEALHEQGRWDSVLSVLARCSIDKGDMRSQMALLLSVEPQFRTGIIQQDGTNAVFHELNDLATSNHDISIRIRAVVNAAYLMAYKPQPALTARMASIVESFNVCELDEETSARLAIARAILCYHNHDITASVDILQKAISKLTAKGLTTLVTASAHIALANMYSGAGNYAASVIHNNKAFTISSQIGNDHVSSRVASNLTMCLSRLGEYRKALEWGRVANLKDPLYQTDAILYSVFHETVCHAMLGDNEQAVKRLAVLESIAKNGRSLRHQQSAYLLAADACIMVGRKPDALLCGQIATSGELTQMQTPVFAGIYARWVAACSLAHGTATEAAEKLEELCLRRKDYDRIDQVEILCARIWLDRRRGVFRYCDQTDLAMELTSLPAAIPIFLRRLGFLEDQ